MSSTPNIPSTEYSLIEAIVNTLPPKAQQDARSLFQSFSSGIAQLQTQQGVAPGSNSSNIATPPLPSLAAAGSNGSYTLTITPPKLTTQATLWYRISYSPIKGFTSGVTTLQPSTSTSVVLNLPNQNLFFQVEASYTNNGPWTQAVLAAQTATSSGLVSSSATSEAGAFNQTNLAVVTSTAIGATAAIQVQGAGGPLTSMVRVKGSLQQIRPAATIIGIPPSSTQYVGYDGQAYQVSPTLAGLLDDGIEPVGKVSVVGTGTPTLPTIVPIISGGQIVGYNVTNGGAGASGDYDLALADVGGGTGATFGEQTIVAGVLISVAPGNPGQDYSGGTTVVASGGIFPGVDGGGTAVGNTNGRLTI
jgi:hypothetical protein